MHIERLHCVDSTGFWTKCSEVLQALLWLAPNRLLVQPVLSLVQGFLLHVLWFPLTIQPCDHPIFMYIFDPAISSQPELDLSTNIISESPHDS